MGAYNVVSRTAMAAGQPEDISVVLANLDAIASVLNGGIDNSNINATAAILASKLANYPADLTKLLRGDGTWAQILNAQIDPAAAIQRAKLERNFTMVYLANPVTTTNGITISVPWDGEQEDDLNQHAASAFNIVIARTATYLVTAFMSWANAGVGDRLMQIMVNGVLLCGQANPRDGINGFGEQSAATVVQLTAGDQVRMDVTQSSGGNLNSGSGIVGGPRLQVMQVA